jgi:hypothetical protein
MITRAEIDRMFEGMAEDTDWDLSGPLLWGYFFTDADEGRLRDVAPLLEAQGYRVVEIFLAEKDEDEEDEPDEWWLHVERLEHHTPASLDMRNQLLYAFASTHGLASYDGMDVGAAPH